MNNFAIFGNPIHHSRSPEVHALFAAKTGVYHTYGSVLVPLNCFEQTIFSFFKRGGLGANITAPFKEHAFLLCNQFTKRSSITKTVNTIKKQADGSLLGDNTDGVGLINDLLRLNVLQRNSKILLIGAGGVARGVILSLLNYGCKLVLTNRTFSRAQQLVDLYKDKGDISSLPINLLSILSNYFDIIINATSSSLEGTVPLLPASIITPSVFCYDMHYQHGDTPFITWCRHQGALFYSDGLGMLVGQAAESFFLWHNILPSFVSVLNILHD